GAPDISPLTKEKTTGPAKSSEPSSSTSASPQPAKNGAEGEKAAAVKESNSSDNGNQLGLILGVVAAVAVLGGVAYAVVRRRKAA
ncbi:serine protease, partial [Streptomyces sp. SID7982]|nr:serine protease [Streptomyces sp. SID7982]